MNHFRNSHESKKSFREAVIKNLFCCLHARYCPAGPVRIVMSDEKILARFAVNIHDPYES